MPIVLDMTTPDFYECRITFRDVNAEQKVVNILLSGDTTELELETLLNALEALSNASVNASISARYVSEGQAAPTAALEQNVSNFAAITFQRDNPVNAEKLSYKSIAIPAYINALKDTDLKPVTDNANLNSIVTLLEGNLVMLGADGNYYAGSWDYNRSASGFGTAPARIDGA